MNTGISAGNVQVSVNRLLMKSAVQFSLSEKHSISQLKSCVRLLTLVTTDAPMSTTVKPMSVMSLTAKSTATHACHCLVIH